MTYILLQLIKKRSWQLARMALLPLVLIVSNALTLQAQCTFDGGQGAVLMRDYDTNQGPYPTSYSVFSAAVGAQVSITSPTVVVELCFYGDIDGGTETFDISISGVTFEGGDVGYTPSDSAPYCFEYEVSAASVETDLTDGDIDIIYTLNGAGWTPNALTDSPDNFNAYVKNVTFNYDIPATITSASDRCQNGNDIDLAGFPTVANLSGGMGFFQISPSTSAFNSMTGVLDVSEANPGEYSITYRFLHNGCTLLSVPTTVEIFATPVANIESTTVECQPLNQPLNLNTMLADDSDEGGTFSVVVENGDAVTLDGDNLVFGANYTGGCYTITYTLNNTNGCTGTFEDEAVLRIVALPTPELVITGPASPVCSDGGTVQLMLSGMDLSTNAFYTVDGVTATTASVGTIDLAAPTELGSISYEICLREVHGIYVCPGAPAPVDMNGCIVLDCQTYTIFNDGTGCGANAEFASECEPDLNQFQVCPISTMDRFDFSCGLFPVQPPMPFPFIEARVENIVPAIAFCDTEEICFDYQGSLPGALGDLITGGPTLAEIGGPATEAACAVITYTITIPIIDVEIDPLPFPPFIEMACDQTISQFIVSAIADQVNADGGGGLVVADTDGDGAFDQVVATYDFPGNGSACIDNNVQGAGVITIRNVVAFPFDALSACGTPMSESVSLTDILPIGLIPVIGSVVEAALAAEGCNFSIDISDEATVQIPVYNNSVPVFANCNPAGYQFSEDGICDTEANWSVPVAYGGCDGGILPYRGRTDGTDATNFNGTATDPVMVTESGIYQTSGPIPGSDLPPGEYEVTYTAYSCSGVAGTCSFPLVVTAGDPLLACPSEVTVKTDVDRCDAVVTGIEPRQGTSCASVINYSVAFADGTMAATNTPYTTATQGTLNDASGLVFPLGESTVTYTLLVDINGDGDVDDTIDGTMERQTCSFTVTVVDAQTPTAACIDVEVRLDNTGNVTVFAVDQMDGSPFADGGSTDNCDMDLAILIAKAGEAFDDAVSFDCTEIGYNLVTLQVTDDAGNASTCISQILVEDFFEGIQFDFDIPELCFEANNPEQLDFSNYLVITLPDGTVLSSDDVAGNPYLGDAIGAFGISVFVPAAGTTGINPGSITPEGQFTPGDGTGFVTVSYVLALPGVSVPQNGNVALAGCLEIAHTIFEVRQPLEMDSPECECIVQNDRVVNLGEVTGGLEPYTIQYGGVKLDVDNDGFADDVDGEFTYEGTFLGSAGTIINFDINNFTEDLGNLLVDYTQPTWSFTVVDARGCELFRSGSCDNDDENGTPEILCENLGPVALTTEEFVCEAQYTWEHTLPSDNCDVILYTYTITNPDGSVAGPFDITALLNPDITNPLPDQFFATYDFEHFSPTENVSTVTYYAEDAVGNFSQCSFEVTVTDDDPPRFINCPEPAVVVDAPPLWCSAYANYALPLAEDNCDIPVVTQVDDTGLTSGDIYPVGITINTFEAVDATGNSTRCDVKIIVNDYHTPPSFTCPNSVTRSNDFGDCGAEVDNIAPSNITDNCPDNLTVAYRIEDENGNEVANGLDDASGNFFELGTSTVRYSLQDMPLLLITEITHDLSDPVDGTLPVPAFTAGNPATGDYLEITNFNSASLDISCLMIERLSAGGSDFYAVPTGTILAPGGVVVIHFGDGTDSPADNFFNLAGAADLGAAEPTAYIVSLSRAILDVAVLNDFDISGLAPPTYNLAGRTVADYWSGSVAPVHGSGIIRTTVWDTNTAADFAPGEACLPTTIGALNPGLPQPTPNGAQTAIQAQPTTRIECSFTVTVTDEEDAVCGLYGDYQTYSGDAETINFGECVEAVVLVIDLFTIADLNLLLTGNAGDFADLTFTLISPEGTEIELVSEACAGSTAFDVVLDGDPELAAPLADNCADLGNGLALVPAGNIEAFNGEQVQGNWTLQIAHNGVVTTDPASLTAWSLLISAREDYDQTDVTLENDLDLCGAEYTYLHPILFDNCPGGTLQLTITFEDGTVEVNQVLPIFPENTEYTYFFQVGETAVLYTLTDAAGNTSSCGFTVTVLDTQFPELTCPPDLVIQLGPGECETTAYPTTPIFEFDNCPEYVLSSFPPGTPVPIGDTIITLIITDASGNETTCTYNLTVLEFETAQELACVSEQNVSLGADCEATITAEMLLTGNLYRCYDNYIVTLYPDLPDTGVAPIETSPVITVDYVGETIIAEICDPDTGECCWGYINVEYKLIPEFICPSDTLVNCTDLTGPDLLGYPEVTSCVPGGAIITYSDQLVDNGSCGEPRFLITRTWTVSDGVGNAAQCAQTIEVASFDLDQIEWPENYDGIANPVLDCSELLADPSLTSPDSLGYPTINGANIYEAIYCSAGINFIDETFYICDNSYLLFRTWRVINQCLPNPLTDVRQFTQIIRVEDADGPDLNCPEDATISVSPFNCTATYQIPVLEVLDACSDVSYLVQVDGDTLLYRPDNQYIVTGLERGNHTVTYLAQDACGIRSQCSYTVTVEDQIAPFAVCDDELNVSIGGGDILNGLYGQARILATDVDEGSSDNCSTVTLEVRRNYWRDNTCDASANRWSPWGNYIDFYCCDINNEITIELRVTDAVGNQNTCWMVITPEDKLNPYCYAPENVDLTCNDLPLAFPGDIAAAYDEDFEATSIMMSSIFGGATGTDNCAVDTIVERTPNIQVNDCGWGTITRRFEAWQLRPEGDANGNGAIDINEVFRSTNSCSQLITITEIHDFTIDFPEDADADCGAPDVPTIITTTVGCDVLSVNIGDPVIFAATGDECYKLSITYDVINWCVWDGEYEGLVLPRMTEDDGEDLPVDRAVEGNERPVVRVVSGFGPVDNNCDEIADPQPGVQYTVVIDRNHNDRDGDSSIPNAVYDNIPGNNIACIPADQFGRRNYGRYVYTQFVKVYDSTVPVVTVGEYGGPTANCPDLLAGQFGDDDGDCEEVVSIPFSVADECELFDGAGNLVISIVSAELDAFAVDANGDGDIKSNEFVADLDVADLITDNGDGTYSFDGTFPIITSAMGDNIYHAVRVLFADGCGNQASETIVFDVIDCKGPAPVCINGLTVTLMPNEDGGCSMAIWASDFEGSAISDCTGQGPEEFLGLPRVTKYAIYRAADVEADPNFVPSPDDTGLVLTDADDQNTIVYVYAFDEEGNYDYCETYVLVQLHAECSGDPGTIQGVIATETNEPVEGVEVSISGGMNAVLTTNADGTFSFILGAGGDYSITPYLNSEPLNGVSTFDLVLISKHILGVQPLNSPYKLIAADVNRSETVTTLDMIQLRKLILNIDTEFSTNTSWRFVNADYAFPVATNPWVETFPEIYNINNVSAIVNADFVGVKIGDVNGSAHANALAGDDRTLNGIFHLQAEDIAMKAGNTYTVAITADNLNQIEGYQGTLQLSGVELVDIEYGLATTENFGMRYAAESTITMSWNHNGGDGTTSVATTSVATTDVLFSLVLRATEDQPLREALSITSRYTAAEAYPSVLADISPERGEEVLDLGLVFSGRDAMQSVFTLYQNTPNPFAGATLIGFNLPASQAGLPTDAGRGGLTSVSVTINDASGRVLTIIKGDYAAGYNSINVTKQMIKGATGVLSYTVTTDNYTATKQMIVVD